MRRWLKNFLPDHAAIDGNRWLAPFRRSLLHPRLWHLNRRSAAGGVAAGLFCGMLPAPFQMLSAALAAILFRINLPLAIFTTLYTNPLTFIPLYIVAYWLGGLILGTDGQFIPPPEFSLSAIGPWLTASAAWLGQLGMPLVVGVLTLASLFAGVGYALMRLAWRWHLQKKWRKRHNPARITP